MADDEEKRPSEGGLEAVDEALDALDALLKSPALGHCLAARGVNVSLALTAAFGLRAYLHGDKAAAIEDLGTAVEEIAARASLKD